MKFNVHAWTGDKWLFVKVVEADTDREAVHSVAKQFHLKGSFCSYPHESASGSGNPVYTEVE